MQDPHLDHGVKARVPSGPTNIDMYVSREETWEHIAMGHPTYREQETTLDELAKELDQWDARWKAAGGQS